MSEAPRWWRNREWMYLGPGRTFLECDYQDGRLRLKAPMLKLDVELHQDLASRFVKILKEKRLNDEVIAKLALDVAVMMGEEGGEEFANEAMKRLEMVIEVLTRQEELESLIL